ncbi:MAG: preprotein translocase subunit SecG [Oscillospiraceae bacterium]|nr:preprotein translocase subunit SecG [Oscillospiraceae bacterium]
MSVLEIIGGVLLLICCLALIGLVMKQEAKQGGLGSSFGEGSDSYYGKNSGRTLEAVLGRFTKYFGIAFFVLVILVSIFTVHIG